MRELYRAPQSLKPDYTNFLILNNKPIAIVLYSLLQKRLRFKWCLRCDCRKNYYYIVRVTPVESSEFIHPFINFMVKINEIKIRNKIRNGRSLRNTEIKSILLYQAGSAWIRTRYKLPKISRGAKLLKAT